jgi:ribosomal protein L11 methyltransferase
MLHSGWGDGHHPTTLLSLQFLAERIKPDLKQKVLDYGTGSAVLAMASIRFGCESVLAVDIDDEALVRTCMK